MRISFLFVLGVIFGDPSNASGQTSCALKNISVIPMTSEIVLPDQTVVIENGVITVIGDSQTTSIPAGMTVVDGRGKYLIPGLFDMHVHFFQEQGGHRNTNEAELAVMLANGLTTVRIMAGHPDYLTARRNVDTGKWRGPQLFVTSPQFAGRWPWPKDFKNFEIADSPETARAAVINYKRDGYDAIKLTFMLAREVYDEVIKTAGEENIPVTGHVGPKVGLPTALATKLQIEHMDEFIDMLLPDTSFNHGQSVSDMNIWRKNAWETVPHLQESRIPDLVRRVKEAGVFVTPTNFFFLSCFGEGRSNDQYRGRPDYGYIPPVIMEERWQIKKRYWDNAPPLASREKYVALRKKMTSALWKAGVPLMAGSDSPEWFLVPGFSIHDELQTFVDAGLTPFASLQTATVNPATYLRVLARKGTIEAGKEADLVILNANPLQDIKQTRSIHAVVRGGEYIDKEVLQKMLREAKKEITQGN